MKEVIKSFVPDFIMKTYRNYREQKKIKLYQGDNVFCPICKSKFKIFQSHGLKKRKNARCWNCFSLERHRLLFMYLTDKTNVFDDKEKIKLLHFAPEKFFYYIFCQKQNIEYVPCDLVPEKYNHRYKGDIKVQKVDITRIPFEENSFDVILCSHVLEHVPNDIEAMGELYRVMKKGGWGIFQVPIHYKREETYEDFTITTPKEREKAFGQHNHVRIYGRDYTERMKSVGFEVRQDDYVKRFSPDELFRYGVSSSHLINYCSK